MIISELRFVVNYGSDGSKSTIIDKIKEASKYQNILSSFSKELHNMNDADDFTGLDDLLKKCPELDSEMRSMAKGVASGKNSIKEFDTTVGKASSTASAFGATFKTVAANMGIMIAISLAIKGAAAAFDAWNVTVEETKEKIDETTASIKELNEEKNLLTSRDSDTLSKSEKERLKYLNDRTAAENTLLDIEKRKMYHEELDSGLSSYFDKDSLYNQYYYATSINKNGDTGLPDDKSQEDIFKDKINKYQESLEKLNNLQSKISAQKPGDGVYETLSDELEKEHDKYTKYYDDLTSSSDLYFTNMTKYADLQSKAKEAIDSGLLTGTDAENAKKYADYFGELVAKYEGYYNKIQKLQFSEQSNLNVVAERSGISSDTLKENFSDEELTVLVKQTFDKDASIEDLEKLLAEEQTVADNKPIKTFAEAMEYSPEVDEGEEKESPLADTISNYRTQKKEIDKLISQIDKGTFDTDNLLDVAQKYGIIGNSVDDVKKQLEDLNNETLSGIISQIDLAINNTEDQGTKKSLELLKSSIENLNNIEIKSPLEQIQSLATGLDQLDKIYADVYNKEDFDWSSILNNDNFKDTFGDMGNAYDDFIKQVSNAPSDIGACQNAFNGLVTAYINSSDALKNLTDDTKDATVAMLKQMGVENASEMVSNALAAQKYATANGCRDLASATWEQISALIAEGDASETTRGYLAALAMSKIDINNVNLNTQSDVDNIIAIANAAGASAAQLDSLKSALASLSSAATSTWNNANPAGGMGTTSLLGGTSSSASASGKIADFANKTKENVDNLANARKSLADEWQKIKDKNYELDPSDFYAKYSGGSSAAKAAQGASKGASEAKEATAQVFDFIETKLSESEKTVEKFGKAFSKAFTLSDAQSKYGAYVEQIQNGIAANTRAIEEYQKILDQIGLSSEWVAKVQSGAFSIDSITDDTLKQQIQDYQSYYEKVQTSMTNIEALQEKYEQAQKDYADSVISSHEKEIAAFEKIISLRKTYVSIKEAFGGSASKSDLTAQENASAAQINRLQEQNQYLGDLIQTTTYGGDAWSTYNDQIEKNNDSILSLTESLASLATEIANLPIDKYEAFLDKTSSKNDLYSAKLDNATSTKRRNSILSKQMKIVESNNAKANSTADTTESNLASSISAFNSAKNTDKLYVNDGQRAEIDTYYKKIKSYTKSKKQVPASLITKLAQGGYSYLAKAVANYNAALVANETAQTTAKLSNETSQTEITELAKQKFQNIQDEFDRKQTTNNNKMNIISAKLDVSSAKGYLSSASWYNQLIAYEQQNTSNLRTELKKLKKDLQSSLDSGAIKEGSTAWIEMTSQIDEVTVSIEESKKSLQEFINQLQQVEFDNFDYLQEQLSRITSEANYYIDLMQNKKMSDDGGITNYGLAAVGLHRQNYDTYIAQAQKYGEEIQRINAQLANDPYNTTLIKQLQEYTDLQQQSIINSENEKSAIADLMKDGYSALTDSLSDLIKKYKEMLQSAKDAYDYQNTITEKSDDINSLKKQISAYSRMSGNDELASKLQKLNSDLADAEKDIQETMYDKYISDTQDALDDMLNELETFLSDMEKDIEKLFIEGTNAVKNNTSVISNTISSLSTDYGTTLSTAMSLAWNDNYYNPESGINQIISAINQLIEVSDAQADSAAFSTAKGKYTNTTSLEEQIANSNSNASLLRDEMMNAKSSTNVANARQKEMLAKYGKKSAQYAQAHAEYLNTKESYTSANAKYKEALEYSSNLQQQLNSVMAANKTAVQSFLQSIVNTSTNKPATSQTELDQKVQSITGGYLTDFNKSQLASLLGTNVNDSEIVEKLKAIGFRTGGIAKFVKASGENGLMLARNGEGFVSPEHVDAIRDLLNVVPDMTKFVNLNTPDYSKLSSARLQNNNMSFNFGDIVTSDPKDFKSKLVGVLKNDKTVQNALGELNSSSMTGSNSLGIRKF